MRWSLRTAGYGLLLSMSCAWSQTTIDTADEAALKAAYLVNFTRFVEWSSDSDTTTLCVGAQSKVVQSLTDAMDSTAAKHVSLVVDPPNLDKCQLLFVDAATATKFSDSEIAAIPHLLTVTDLPAHQAKAFVIRLYLRDLKLRFSIDIKKAKAADYAISSTLLRLSKRLD